MTAGTKTESSYKIQKTGTKNRQQVPKTDGRYGRQTAGTEDRQ